MIPQVEYIDGVRLDDLEVLSTGGFRYFLILAGVALVATFAASSASFLRCCSALVSFDFDFELELIIPLDFVFVCDPWGDVTGCSAGKSCVPWGDVTGCSGGESVQPGSARTSRSEAGL